MSTRTPLILGLICLALAAFVWKFESKWRTSDEKRAVASRVFPLFDREAVDRIEVRAPGNSLTLRRDGTKWMLVEPVKYPADRFKVDQLLNAVEFLEQVETFEVKNPGKDLAQYGLERPRVVLRMSWHDKDEAIELRQGKDSAMGSRVYAQVQKGKPTVYVVGGAVFHQLDKPLDDWRDRSLLDVVPSKVDSITLTRDGKEVELRRRDNAWHIMRPFLARASTGAVDHYLDALSGVRVSQFVAKDNSNLKAFGLAEPSFKVSLHEEGKSGDTTVHFGGPTTNGTGAVYARREDIGSLVFTVATNNGARWNVPLDDLRDKTVAGVGASEVSAVILRSGSNTLSAVRTSDGWRLGGTNGAPANGQAVDAFVQRIAALEASRFVADAATDLKAAGFDPPGTTVTLTVPARNENGSHPAEKEKGKDKDKPKDKAKDKDRNGAGSRTRELALEWGRVSGGETLCRNTAEPFILAVTNSALEFLKVAPWDWRDLAVITRKASDVTEVTVATNGVTRVFTRTATGWKTDGRTVDETAMAGLVGQLTALRAQQWLGPRAPDAKVKPVATYRFAEGSAAWELQVWPQESDGTAVACLPSASPLYFRLSAADLTLLHEPMTDASPPDAAPAPPKPPQ